MTTVYIDPVLASCLSKAEQKIGTSACLPRNDQQSAFVAALPGLQALAAKLPDGMLESIGSTNADPINEFMAARGLSINLPDLQSGEFACAAVLDILVRWAIPGVRADCDVVAPDKSEHPGVEMAKGFKIHRNDEGLEIGEPLIDGGEVTVLMCMSTDLASGMDALRQSRRPSPDDYKGLMFPMIDLDMAADASIVRGLSSGGYTVTQAFAQAKLRLNEFGAHAKAGAAIVVYRGPPPKVMEIDKPFTLAFLVADQIVLAFHLTPECWRQPPNLATKADKAAGEVW